MNKIVILNHKMNLEYDEVIPYIQKLNEVETENSLIVCPSFLYLSDFMNHCTWGVGAQNVSENLDGNYTGEVSTLQLKSVGVEYVILGHYERRKYFYETTEQIRKKLNACMDANISPIVCFGETGNIDEVLEDLEKLLKGIERIDFIIFAYEPLRVAEQKSTIEIQEQIKEIYHYLYDRYQIKPNLVYGGGIARKDIKALLEFPELSGIMIGKVSANIEQVQKIIKEIDG